MRNSKVLILTKTWLDNHDNIDIPHVNCIAQFKGPQKRAAGGAVYHNANDQPVLLYHKWRFIMQSLQLSVVIYHLSEKFV